MCIHILDVYTLLALTTAFFKVFLVGKIGKSEGVGCTVIIYGFCSDAKKSILALGEVSVFA